MEATASEMGSALRGGLMVCGTTSDAGKTTIVAGLCRLLQRQGVRVAPFKAQNMALNSAVTRSGHEIGRAQFLQAQAAKVEPEVVMNPILLKPTSQRASQVIVMGKSVGVMSAREYHEAKPALFDLVVEAFEDLRSRFDVVLLEGAGSPTEINLLANDIVNLGLAERVGVKAIVVGDIDLGGVFASLYGTVALLPDNLSSLVEGFVINKLRGDPALLLDGTQQLEDACGVPTLGVVPMLEGLQLDQEDSLALAPSRLAQLARVESNQAASTSLDVAVVHFPHISNFTDIDPLILESDLSVRFVRSVRELGRPDLVILPGSKSTVDDLAWLRGRGLDGAIMDLAGHDSPMTILGICGGYQMLGLEIDDQVEGMQGRAAGLGLLPVDTRFDQDKVLARPTGRALGQVVEGYQIHHGRVVARDGAEAWLTLADSPEGVVAGGVFGTTLHGLFENDGFRRSFLQMLAHRAGIGFTPSSVSAAELRDSELDRLADHLGSSLDMEAVRSLIQNG